jgi:hypothetical protein
VIHRQDGGEGALGDERAARPRRPPLERHTPAEVDARGALGITTGGSPAKSVRLAPGKAPAREGERSPPEEKPPAEAPEATSSRGAGQVAARRERKARTLR